MSDKFFTVQDGDEIIVRVPKSKKSSDSAFPSPSAQRGRSLIRTQQPDDILPRRLSAKAGQFYDLAQILSGENWITKNISILKDPYFQAPSGFVFPVLVPELTSGEKNQIVSDLMVVGAENLSETYREIKKSNAASLPIFIAGYDSDGNAFGYDSRLIYPNWTEKGLRMTPKQLAGDFRIQGLTHHFPVIGFNGLSNLNSKITNVFDVDAPNVIFTPKADDAIFLVPTVPVAKGYHATIIAGTPNILRETFLNLIYRFAPRYFDESGAVYETTEANHGSLEAYNRMVEVSPVRTFTIESDGGSYGDIASGGDFLATGTIEAQPFDISYSSETFRASQDLLPAAVLPLKAVIKQGANFFYVWA